VIAAVCCNSNIDEKELASPTKRLSIAHARALVSHIATRDSSIYGSEVGCRLKEDRSAVSRAAQRVGNDADLMAAARTFWGCLNPKRVNIETTSPLLTFGNDPGASSL
jgi:hypothetical protein